MASFLFNCQCITFSLLYLFPKHQWGLATATQVHCPVPHGSHMLLQCLLFPQRGHSLRRRPLSVYAPVKTNNCSATAGQGLSAGHVPLMTNPHRPRRQQEVQLQNPISAFVFFSHFQYQHRQVWFPRRQDLRWRGSAGGLLGSF